MPKNHRATAAAVEVVVVEEAAARWNYSPNLSSMGMKIKVYR